MLSVVVLNGGNDRLNKLEEDQNVGVHLQLTSVFSYHDHNLLHHLERGEREGRERERERDTERETEGGEREEEGREREGGRGRVRRYPAEHTSTLENIATDLTDLVNKYSCRLIKDIALTNINL